jgi:hypothetical protein
MGVCVTLSCLARFAVILPSEEIRGRQKYETAQACAILNHSQLAALPFSPGVSICQSLGESGKSNGPRSAWVAGDRGLCFDSNLIVCSGFDGSFKS